MWHAMRRGDKKFEIRSEHDRVFTRHDELIFIPWDRLRSAVPSLLSRPMSGSGSDQLITCLLAKVGLVVHGFGLPANLCVFGLEELMPNEVTSGMIDLGLKTGPVT